MPMPGYLIAVDLGQQNDPTALAVLEQGTQATGRKVDQTQLVSTGGPLDNWIGISARVDQFENTYRLIHLDRLPLGSSYTEVPKLIKGVKERLAAKWRKLAEAEIFATDLDIPLSPPPGAIEIVIDATGVGRPVVDLLRDAGVETVAITIHGGEQVHEAGPHEVRVPKRDLVSALLVLMQTRRLIISPELEFAPVLKQELQNFKAKISLSGHDSYGAGADWREGNHDDLLLAASMGVWFGEYRAGALSTVHWPMPPSPFERSYG